MPLFNTDLNFYGGLGGFGGNPGVFQPWQMGGGQQSPYLGFSSFAPQQGAVPATLSGFLQQNIPELSDVRGLSGLLGQDLRQSFSEFRGSERALQQGGSAQFTQELLGREDVQGLLRRSELGGEGAFVQAGEGAQGLSQLVSGQLGTEGSALRNIYGGGIGAEAITEDLRRLLTGGQSAIGAESSTLEFGGRGQHTDASRQALAAQLLGGGGGGGPIDIGGGQAFNPFSQDILSDVYNFDLGQQEASATSRLRLAGGILSTQNRDITSGMAQTIQQAAQGGADLGFGGSYGYQMTSALGNLADPLSRTGGVVRQAGGAGGLGSLIDEWYNAAGQGGYRQGLAQNVMGSIVNPQRGQVLVS